MSATWETVGFSTVTAHLWDAPHHEAAPFHPYGNATAGERSGGFHFSWEGGGLCVYIIWAPTKLAPHSHSNIA